MGGWGGRSDQFHIFLVDFVMYMEIIERLYLVLKNINFLPTITRGGTVGFQMEFCLPSSPPHIKILWMGTGVL